MEAKWLPGYSGGLVMDVMVSDIFFLQIDLIYAQNNALYSYDPNIHDPDKPSPGKAELTTKVNAVQLPVAIRFATYDRKVTSYFETGFYGGYIIDGTYRISAENEESDRSGNIDFSSYKRGDFGFIIGGGFGTKLGKKSAWKLNLRYLFSTFDTYKYPEKNNKEYVKSQYRRFSLNLIFLFL